MSRYDYIYAISGYMTIYVIYDYICYICLYM